MFRREKQNAAFKIQPKLKTHKGLAWYSAFTFKKMFHIQSNMDGFCGLKMVIITPCFYQRIGFSLPARRFLM